ncbi:hypothetical protein FOC4_g10003011 [Fusarium odoratissimum]|uniref:Uncharacterized protein n=1 Tax=Fusarium oxysporum f. sp. cubense (strain race 4) TaxID=2502994 RepID=N1RRD5_FUSC4|nr:hypothetical protein FOC4_g10003011 [Fusarium odoratissimum]
MAHRLAPRGGVDLEALSPRDANAQRVPKVTDIKTKTAAQLKAAKEKEHPPPPPTEVPEPPSTDRPDGATYQNDVLAFDIISESSNQICSYNSKRADLLYTVRSVDVSSAFELQLTLRHGSPTSDQISDLETAWQAALNTGAKSS